MSDGNVVISVELDDKGAIKGVSGIESTLVGVKKAAEKVTTGVKEIATALGLVKVASEVFDLIRESIGKAFKRIDTMEQFDRVMSTITGSAETANKALETTNGIVKGTAYGLDVAANSVQNFVTRGLEVDMATNSVAAWGDAVAFYGDGSNTTFASVTDALSKMVTKGNVDMEQMNRLFDAGIPALDIYANAVGKSTEEVADQISKGELKAEDFMRIMNAAFNEGVEGFASIEGAAKDAGASWGATFDNMAAAVARGVTSIIQEIDKLLEDNGLPTMREIVSTFGEFMEDSLKKVAEAIPEVVDQLKEMYDWCTQLFAAIEPLTPAIYGLSAALTSFYIITHIVGWLESGYLMLLYFGDAILSVLGSVKGFFALLAAHPIALLVAAVIGLVVAIVTLWKTNESFRDGVIKIWGKVKEVFINTLSSILEFFGSSWEAMKDSFKSASSFIQNVFGSLVSWIGSTMNRMKEWFSETADMVGVNLVEAFYAMKNGVSNAIEFTIGIFESLKITVSELWTAFLNSPVFQILGKLIEFAQGKIARFGEAIKTLISDFDFEPLLKEVAFLIPKIIAIFVSKPIGLVLAGANIINSIAQGMGLTVPELFEIITDFLVGMIEKFAAALPGVIQIGVDMITSLVEGITTAIPMVVETLVNIVLSLVNIIVDILPVIIEVGIKLLTALIEGLVTVIPMLIEVIINIVTSLIGVIIGALPLIISAGIELLLALIQGIISILPALIEAAILIILFLIQEIINLLPMIIDLGINILISLVEGIISMLPLIIEAAIELFIALVTALIDMLPVLIEAGITLIESLINAFLSMIPVIIETGLNLLMSLIEAFISLLPVLIDAGIQILMALIEGLIEVLPALIEAGITLIMALSKAIINLIPVLINAGIQILGALIQGLFNMLPKLLSAGWQLITGLVGAILKLIPLILSAGKDLIVALIDGIVSMISGVGTAVSDGIQGAIDTVAGFLSKFKEAGSNIVGSIADGIRGAASWVTDAIGNVASKIRDFLPFSPAKEGPLRDLDRLNFGGTISEGIYDGEVKVTRAMNHILDLPDIRKAMPNVGNGLALAGATTSTTSIVNNEHKPTIHIEKIENYADTDIPAILEESAWIMSREGNRL